MPAKFEPTDDVGDVSRVSDEAPKRQPPDWERIEIEYRAGILSLREIASLHSISHVAVNKRAKRDGWTRDLAAKIQAKADALVTKQAVTAEVTAEMLVTERVVVEANAQAVAQVRIGHRADIRRTRSLCVELLSELEVATGERLTAAALGDLIEELQSPDGLAVTPAMKRAREALDKVLSLPSRAASLKALSDSLKTLVTLEREAWGFGSDAQRPPDLLSDAQAGEDSGAAYRRMIGG